MVLNDFQRRCDLNRFKNVCRRNLNNRWRPDVAIAAQARWRWRNRGKTFTLVAVDRIGGVDNGGAVGPAPGCRTILKIRRVPDLLIVIVENLLNSF